MLGSFRGHILGIPWRSARAQLIDISVGVGDRLKTQTTWDIVASQLAIMHHELKAGQVVLLLELGCDFPRTGEQLKILQLRQIAHSTNLAHWANEHVTLDHGPVVDHRKHVAAPKKDAIGHLHAVEKEGRCVVTRPRRCRLVVPLPAFFRRRA